MIQYKLLNKKNIIVTAVILLYGFGLIGIISPLSDLFLQLTPLTLIATIIFFVLSFQKTSSHLYLVLFIVFFSGLIVEWIGVHTGALFGSYVYGENLGIKLFDVPLIIGVNWALLVGVTSEIARNITRNTLQRVIIASFLMLFLDLLIEPIVSKVDFWYWADAEIPILNYICWFVIAIILNALYFFFTKDHKNTSLPSKEISIWIYCAMVLFFVGLNLLLN
jgi:bisanhydrobacterioruberin hydratase